MSVEILKAGLQTSLQGKPRTGFRHFGVPAAGPADPLSLALANRLVGNKSDALGLEFTLIGGKLLFTEMTGFAVTGASADLHLNTARIRPHETYIAEPGDTLEIGPAQSGCRTYVALSGDIAAQDLMGSSSTYLPGKFGGFEGRALRDGDELNILNRRMPDEIETPDEFRPYFNDRMVVQVTRGANFDLLENSSALLDAEFHVTQRAGRMGVQLSGHIVELSDSSKLTSEAVFPGSIQCPPDGQPFILLSDSQTTGGYPHILQVTRSDRFQLGQLKPGARLRFVMREPREAAERFRARWNAYSSWLSSPVL